MYKWCLGWTSLLVGLCLSTVGTTRAQGIVEGFEGEAVVLPCTVSILGALRWRTGSELLLIRRANGSALPPEKGPWKDVISFVGGSNNLSISSLSRWRDDNRTFTCGDFIGGDQQKTTVRVLARIGGASIEPASKGQVTVTEGISKILTCMVAGDHNPDAFYRWTVDNGEITGQGSNYSLTADRFTSNVTCTATNTYSNGSVLSTAEATATLNVLYMDSAKATSPVTGRENEMVTLTCSGEGNPPPTFEWRRSGSTVVKSTSADYRIENVQRSEAGEYTCNVTNSVGSRQTTVTLIVQYPSDVKVAYDQRSYTLTCIAVGVPDFHTFSPWEHRLGGTLIRRLGAETTGISATYTLPDTRTYTDTGDYVCSATNGVNSPQTGMICVAPLTPAVFQNHTDQVTVSVGRAEKISVSFYERSSYGNVRVRWEKAGESGPLQSHREEPGLVSLVVYGQHVSLLGTVTVLTLTDVRQSDEGNYSVTVITDINGVTRTSGISFNVNVTHKPSTEKDMDVDSAEANTGRIVGCVLGGLVAGVLLTVLTGIFCMRSRTKDLPKGVDHRQMSPAGELSGDIRTLPRIADTSFDHALRTDHHYESTSDNNPRSPGSHDQHYESLTATASGRDNTHKNTYEAEASARTKQSADGANYEIV